MNHVWHIVKKDIRRHGLPYLVWIGLLAAKVAICACAFSPASADADWFERLQLAYGSAATVAFIAGFLLAAAFALDDETTGTRMFWATRPIAGMRLLAAKALGLTLSFVLAPVLVWLPWWLYCGSGWRELWDSALVTMLPQAVAVPAALLVAALTGKSSRFLLLLFAALLLALLTVLFRAGRMFALPAVPTAVAQARDIITLGLIAGGVLGAIWLQYRTRRTAWSTVLAVAGIALGAWASQAWPWAFTNPWRGEARSDAGVETVELRWVLLNRSTPTDGPKIAPEQVRLQAAFQVKNVPETLRLGGGRMRVSLVWPDGTREVQEANLRTFEPEWIARSVLRLGPDTSATDTETRAHREKQVAEFKATRGGKKRPVTRSAGAPDIVLTGELLVPLALAERLEHEKPECRADVRLDFRRPTLQLETPLVVGTGAAGRGARIRVVADLTEPRSGGMSALESYAVVHLDVVHDRWINAVFQRSTGAMMVQSSAKTAGQTPITLLAPFAREIISFRRPLVRRGEAWMPAPGAEDIPTLAVATYEGLLHVRRQCGFSPGESNR